jgi:hypothetical protein
MNQNCETRFLDSIFFFLIMACVVCGTFKILVKNGVLIVFMTVFTWMACGDGHMMVTHILFHAMI